LMLMEYHLTHGTEYLVMWRNILPHVKDEWYSWMKNGWKIEWMNFQMNVGNKIVFVKTWTKETRWNNFMLVYFEKYNTWNVDAILQVKFHISIIWTFATSKLFIILN
jgi:hypothetical protein